MKKKALIASLLLVGIMGIAGCSTGNKSETSSNPGTQTTTDNTTTSGGQTTTSDGGQTTTSNGGTTSQGPVIPEGYELVTSVLDVSTEMETGSLQNDYIKGPFTITKGTEIRTRTKVWEDPAGNGTKSFTKSIKMGKSANILKVKVNGTGKLSFYVQNGSSGVDTRTVIITKGSEVIEKKIPGSAVSPDYPEYPEGSPVVKVTIDVTDGEYSINRDSGTIDIYLAELEVVTEKSELTGFEIANQGVVEYVEGDTYDQSGIVLNEVYGNGRRDSLPLTNPDVKIDASAVNMAKPGVYEVSVKYKEYEAQKIAVTVYQFDDIILGFNRVSKDGNSAAGNGCYVNHPVRQVYAANSTLNHDNLTVKASCSHPTDTSKKVEFTMGEEFFKATSDNFNGAVDGAYDVNVKLTLNNKEKTKSYKVHVVSAAPSEVNNAVQLKVDANYAGTVGAVVEGKNTFTTIQQALEYLDNLGATYKNKAKVLTIANGTYREKLEIKEPNLTIVGESKEGVLIEWDSLVGLKDEGGFEHTTDSTATVAVRDSALNCVIKDLTISNWFNSEARFSERFGAGYPEHRALAMLIQADQFIMDNCKLLGYQDTVEFFTGRQYILNTYISGTTDFIFGTNNTTYFKGCTIHCIDNAKDNGGYITAFKGCNKGDDDAITYGAIFDDCDFTADANILTLKKTSMGRTWGKYAAVMVMNSRIGAHVSTKPSTGAGKDERYVAMNGGNPTQATVQFKEYNNTGDGAITASMDGVTVVDQATAANYNNLAVIFGVTNNKVTYTAAWTPSL